MEGERLSRGAHADRVDRADFEAVLVRLQTIINRDPARADLVPWRLLRWRFRDPHEPMLIAKRAEPLWMGRAVANLKATACL